jgi:hypothetical protein
VSQSELFHLSGMSCDRLAKHLAERCSDDRSPGALAAYLDGPGLSDPA